MKRFNAVLFVAAIFCGSIFAQQLNSPDLQVLAIVKHKGTDSITLGSLKVMARPYGVLTIDKKIELLNSMIDDKLLSQAAEKSGIVVSDSQVNQYFQQQLSQFARQPITEQQFSELLMKTQGMTLDQYIKAQTGMNLAEYKKTLKRQICQNQYVAQHKQSEIQKAAAVSDDEVKSFYNNNRSTFVQPETVEVFHVIIPKGKDEAASKKYSDELLAQLKNGKLTQKTMIDNTEANAKAGVTDVKYVAQNLTIYRMQEYAQQLGMEQSEFDALYSGSNFGSYSKVEEVQDSFRFYSVLSKQSPKFLELSDVIQKGTTATVYKYIENNLSMQKQQMAMLNARTELARTIRDEGSVQMVKSDRELESLLGNW
ncbi:MAG: peptidyl-prolyl cis-trans isomerase [Treponemataceae bacterium]